MQVASIPLFYKIASVVLGAYSGIEGGFVHLGDLLILGSIAFSLIVGVLLVYCCAKSLKNP